MGYRTCFNPATPPMPWRNASGRMILPSTDSTIGLLLSGGLDSSILLGHLLQTGHRVQPFYVRCGLAWEREEVRAVEQLLRALRSERLAELVVLDLPLADVYGDHWSLSGFSVPDAASPDEAVYLPGRNALLLIKPVLWCHLHGIDRLALGLLRSNPFGDATPDFFAEFQAALTCATGGQVALVRPFEKMTKREVMQLGLGQPLELTFSCIAPSDGRHCGSCNKCAERKAAFALISTKDPTAYAPREMTRTK